MPSAICGDRALLCVQKRAHELSCLADERPLPVEHYLYQLYSRLDLRIGRSENSVRSVLTSRL